MFLFSFCIVETGSHYIAQTGLQYTMKPGVGVKLAS